MVNLLTLLLIVVIFVSAVLGSIAVQVAAFVALLCLAVIFSIVGRVRGTEEEIGLPDHEESQLGRALEEFLASEAEIKTAIVDPVSILGESASYHSKRLGKERMAMIGGYLGHGIYDLKITNAKGELVLVRRHRDNFQLV